MPNPDVAVYGVRDTMNELRNLDKAIYFEAIKEIKRAAKPLQMKMQAELPKKPPLSGMARGRYKWTGKEKVTIKYGGRKDRNKSEWPLLKLELKSPAGIVFDMAGKNTNSPFTRELSARFGSPSRAMWSQEQSAIRATQAAVVEAVREATKLVNQELVQRPTGAPQ